MAKGQFFEVLTNFFLPRHCPACGDYVDNSAVGPLCSSCFEKIEYIRSFFCLGCGRMMTASSALLCSACQKNSFQFDLARSVVTYTFPIRECIWAFKYRGMVSLAPFFGDLLTEYLLTHPDFYQVDGIIPVPLHPARLKQRGFNQSLLLARELSRSFKLPLVLGVKRIKPTRPQVNLSPTERKANLRGAFETSLDFPWSGKKVLIVDDIFTTGSTVNSLSQTLKQAGCDKVLVLTLASTQIS